MDTTALVTEMIEDGKRIVEQLGQNGFELAAALWLKDTENSRWYFYVVTPAYDTEGSFAAYGRLDTAMGPLELNWIDPLEIRVIGPTNPIARDVLAIYASAPAGKVNPTRWGGTRLGNMSVDGVYLYPLPAVANN